MILEERSKKILMHFYIPITEGRQALLKILMASPNEIFSTMDVSQQLKNNGVAMSSSAITNHLIMFQTRHIIRPFNDRIVKKKKRGRPETRFVLNHDLMKGIP
jgi:Fe2+ or Zn2+ uptake regulation protein